MNETLCEVVKLLDGITEEASRGYTKEKTDLAVFSINKAGISVEEQKKASKVTQEAFSKIRDLYTQIAYSFQHAAQDIKTINEKSKNIFIKTQDMAALAEEFAASTEEIAAVGQEQLASTEMIAQSSKGLNLLASELDVEIKKFKVQ